MLVFVPVAAQQATQLRAGADLLRLGGCAATPTLQAALGPDTVTEEAEFAALSNAGVLALLPDGATTRLVLAVDVAASQVHDQRSGEGQVEVAGLRWSEVQALFADEPEAAGAVQRARQAAGGRGLADALSTAAVLELLDGFDLLWYSVEELDALT